MQLALEAGEALPAVQGDAFLLRRLLANLLDNAIDFSPPGGRVELQLQRAADGLEIGVRDRGPGFDLAEVPADRLGVRESIIGRMRRAGGTASVARAPGGGTEVALALDLTTRSASS